MIRKIISIIGGTGKLGSVFAKAFRDKGHQVIISGRKTKITPIEAAKIADIVIITVPINSTERVIKEIGPFVRENSVLTDFTSVKVMPCETMKKYSKAEIIGGHPLFGPGIEISGNKFVLSKVREKSHYIEYKSLLESLGLKIIEISPEEHDKQMAIIQSLNHINSMALADTLKKLNFDLNSELITPNFLLKRSVIGRMLSQDASLYPDIEVNNPYSKEMGEVYLSSVIEIKKMIDKRDNKALTKEIEKLQKYFGNKSSESRELTNEVLNKLKGKNGR